MKFLIALMLLLPISSFAGFSKGNGGNILVCQKAPNMVLDYYELSELHKFAPASNLEEILFDQNMASRLNKLSPKWANEYVMKMQSLETKTRFIESTLESVNDSYVVVIPDECEMRQTAVQINGRILINLPLYKTLSPSQQKILLLHEVLYMMVLEKRKLDDSRPVRALVSLLLSDEYLSMNTVEIRRFLNDNNVIIER